MRLQAYLGKIITLSFYALFFVTPLLFNPSRNLPSFELFEWNKMAFVYLVTIVVTAAWTGQMLLERRLIITRTPFDIPILFFLLSTVISTIFSIDPHVSLFGYYSRFHGGLLSIFCYTLLYFAMVSNRDKVNIRHLLLLALASGTVVALYGIAEKFGIDAHMWVQDVRARVFSTLGQPNWLAALLAILLPLALGFFVHFVFPKLKVAQLTDSDGQDSKSKVTFMMYAGISVIFYICMLLTRSRSGFLGFWLAYTIFWLGLFWKDLQYRKRLVKWFGIIPSAYFSLISSSQRHFLNTIGCSLTKHFYQTLRQRYHPQLVTQS
jgi:hypothetical protein